MKKLIVASLLTALVLLTGSSVTLTQAQTPSTDLKPTFISPTPTPGLYVNGWPPFTVAYPKEWEEVPLQPFAVLEVAGIRPDSYPIPVLQGQVFVNPFPLEDWAKVYMPAWVNVFTDIKVLSDKPSQLKDGTPAREVEFEFVPKVDVLQRSMRDASKHNGLLLATKKDLTWVAVILTDDRGKIGEELKGLPIHSPFCRAGRSR